MTVCKFYERELNKVDSTRNFENLQGGNAFNY